jgi:hypothetical protein
MIELRSNFTAAVSIFRAIYATNSMDAGDRLSGRKKSLIRKPFFAETVKQS